MSSDTSSDTSTDTSTDMSDDTSTETSTETSSYKSAGARFGAIDRGIHDGNRPLKAASRTRRFVESALSHIPFRSPPNPMAARVSAGRDRFRPRLLDSANPRASRPPRSACPPIQLRHPNHIAKGRKVRRDERADSDSPSRAPSYVSLSSRRSLVERVSTTSRDLRR